MPLVKTGDINALGIHAGEEQVYYTDRDEYQTEKTGHPINPLEEANRCCNERAHKHRKEMGPIWHVRVILISRIDVCRMILFFNICIS